MISRISRDLGGFGDGPKIPAFPCSIIMKSEKSLLVNNVLAK
mgnify:FL=1